MFHLSWPHIPTQRYLALLFNAELAQIADNWAERINDNVKATCTASNLEAPKRPP